MILPEDLNEEALKGLANEGMAAERSLVARHPNASLQTLLFLAQIGFADEVYENPLMPLYIEGGSDEVVLILVRLAEQTKSPERLQELASSGWGQVRLYVAWNDNTPLEVLLLLSEDESADVRSHVAKNSKSTPEMLLFFSKDESHYVRHKVALNVKTPPEALTSLAKDPNESVRRGLLLNIRVPLEALSILIMDENQAIRYDAHTILNKRKKVHP